MSIEKQQLLDFYRQLKNSKTAITITYETKPLNSTSSTWQEGTGIKGQYDNVKALQEIITTSQYRSYPFSNVIAGKAVFRIKYDGYDFSDKKYVKVLYDNKIYTIKNILAIGDLGYKASVVSEWNDSLSQQDTSIVNDNLMDNGSTVINNMFEVKQKSYVAWFLVES